MFHSRDPQALEVCPYNSSHRILKYRMSTHIAKCRKQHEQSAMSTCFFNATHSIPETELQYHLEHCPDRFNLDKQVFISEDVDQTKFPIPQIDVEVEESWDNMNRGTYDAEGHCLAHAVLRQLKVESAAQRKNFRTEERSRIQKLKDKEPSTSGSNANCGSKFRSTALANTTTNVDEEAPFSYDDIERIIHQRNVKPLIVDPNHDPVFVKSATDVVKPKEKENDRKIETEQIPDIVTPAPAAPAKSTGAVKKQI